MSEQMKMGICKACALGQTAEATASAFNISTDEVSAIWSEGAALINEYKEFFKEMEMEA